MGRAPTSGYCHNCRKRRVICDRSKPHCQRCTKAGYECKGYELPLRMQSHVVATDPRGRERVVVLRTPSATAISHSVALTAPRLPLNRRVACTDEELAFSYFFQNYVWAHFWRPIMRMVAPSHDVAYTASLAVATGVRAIAYDNKALTIRARDLYGTAINLFRQQLSRAMEDKTEMAELATTVIILSMFTYAVDGNISLVDQSGVDAILQYCGPELFQEEPLLTTFRSCRAIVICRAFNQGQRTFLERPEWKTLPWLHHPKCADDKLQDISVHLPAIAEEVRGSKQLNPGRVLELVDLLDGLSRQLDTWRWEWEDANVGAAKVGIARGHDTSAISEPFLAGLLASRIEVQSIVQGLDINLYNTIRVYIGRLRELLLGDGRKSREQRRLSAEDLLFLEETTRRHRDSPLLLPGEARLPCQYAIETARLLPYLAENLASRKERVALMLSPTGIIFSALKAQPELEQWTLFLRSRVTFLKGPERELTPFDIFASFGE